MKRKEKIKPTTPRPYRLEAALKEAEGKVERELFGLRDQCGELSRDKLLLEEEVRRLRRTQEHLEIAQAALSSAKAELRNQEGEASTRAAAFEKMEAELFQERERREQLEKKVKKNGGASAEEASRLAAEAAAREVGLHHCHYFLQTSSYHRILSPFIFTVLFSPNVIIISPLLSRITRHKTRRDSPQSFPPSPRVFTMFK